MAVDGVEPPFVTMDHRQVVGLSRLSALGLTQSAMHRITAGQLRAALNGSYFGRRIRVPDPEPKFTPKLCKWRRTE